MRLLIIIGSFLIVGLIAVWFFVLKPQLAFGQVASAYAAKQICSCRFVAERDMESCKSDFTEDISALTVTERDQSIETSALFELIKSSATFEQGLGCTLD